MIDTDSETLSASLTVDFPEYRLAPNDPVKLLTQFLDRAESLGVREARALSLATVDGNGIPHTRIVVLANFTERGVRFATQKCSNKYLQLQSNSNASGLLYWRETGEQISFSGQVHECATDIANQFWSQRPQFTHAMSVASRQSEPLLDPDLLRNEADRLSQKGPLPMPDNYCVMELAIQEIEFWNKGKNRLHERLSYSKSGSQWEIKRLQP